MRYKVCIPFIVEDLSCIPSMLPAEFSSVDLIEIYVDALSPESLENLPAFQAIPSARCILTFRRPEFAPQVLPAAKRQELLKKLSGGEFLCDFDIQREREDIDFIKAHNLDLKIVTSSHNYTETPSLEDLKGIYEAMKKVSPAYVKFAAFTARNEDCVSLLKLLAEIKSERDSYLVTGMGEKGKVVRITGALWGNAWTYVSLETSLATAKGQLSFEQFHELMELIAQPA